MRIGVFAGATIPVMATAYRAFLEELRRLGFSEDRNLIVDLRQPDQDLPSLSAQVEEMVRSNVDAIVALGSEPPLKAAIAATRSVPIVFVANNFDPIALGYVKGLAKPGGNATGIYLRQPELAEKQVELLTQAFPGKTRLAVLFDSISAHQFTAAQRRATSLRLQVHSMELQNPPYDFEAAFRTIAATNPDMLLVLSSPFFGRQNRHIAELTIRYHLPAMFIFRAYPDAGGLMSYGADPVAMYRQSASYVAKILAGATPADLPVEQPTTFEMIVNLKTAKAIGIELPTSTLLRADEVIE
jgi:putative ABC transport system substrate-binding protein